jgi:hypothetical protein
MDSKTLVIFLVYGVGGLIVSYLVIESAVFNAFKRFKKWEATENEKTN